MRSLVLVCLLVSAVSVLSSETEEKDTCGVDLVRCIEKKLESDEVGDQWVKCVKEETTVIADTIEEVEEFVCNNKDDEDHLAVVEKARECVRKHYETGHYDKAKAECHQEMQDQ